MSSERDPIPSDCTLVDPDAPESGPEVIGHDDPDSDDSSDWNSDSDDDTFFNRQTNTVINHSKIEYARRSNIMPRNVTIDVVRNLLASGFDTSILKPEARLLFDQILEADRLNEEAKKDTADKEAKEAQELEAAATLRDPSSPPRAPRTAKEHFPGPLPLNPQKLDWNRKMTHGSMLSRFTKIQFQRALFNDGVDPELLKQKKNAQLATMWMQRRDERQANGAVDDAAKSVVFEEDGAANGPIIMAEVSKAKYRKGNDKVTVSSSPKTPTKAASKKQRGPNSPETARRQALAALVGRVPLSLPGNDHGLTLSMQRELEASTIAHKYKKAMMLQLLKDYNRLPPNEMKNGALAEYLVEQRNSLREQGVTFQDEWTTEYLENYVRAQGLDVPSASAFDPTNDSPSPTIEESPSPSPFPIKKNPRTKAPIKVKNPTSKRRREATDVDGEETEGELVSQLRSRKRAKGKGKQVAQPLPENRMPLQSAGHESNVPYAGSSMFNTHRQLFLPNGGPPEFGENGYYPNYYPATMSQPYYQSPFQAPSSTHAEPSALGAANHADEHHVPDIPFDPALEPFS